MNRLRHFIHRSGHHVWRLVLVFQTMMLALGLLPGIPVRIQEVALMAGMTIVGLAMVLGLRAHENSLCEVCIDEMPLNGPQKAEDWERYLAAFHWLFRTNPRRFVVLLGVWLTANLLSNHFLPDQVSAVLTYIPAATTILLELRHGRVQPWCKRCRWDEGGEHEYVPTPDPAVTA